MLRDIFVIVNSQRVRQAVIGARHRLVVVPDLSSSEPVEDGIDVGLPVVHRLELADELRGCLLVRRQRGNDAHTAAGFYRRLQTKRKELRFPLLERNIVKMPTTRISRVTMLHWADGVLRT